VIGNKNQSWIKKNRKRNIIVPNMDKLNLSLDFGEDSLTEVTIDPLAKVEVVLARSMYLLDIVKSRNVSDNVEHVYLDLSKCNRNFTLGFFMKNLQSSPSE
jgi:hypothetical protein